MARIELSFNDKAYVIEYNRASIREFLKNKEGKDELEQVVELVKAGLLLHHQNEMPSDDNVFGWLMAMGEDLKDFADALHGMVQDVLNTIKEDRKNLKWEKVV